MDQGLEGRLLCLGKPAVLPARDELLLVLIGALITLSSQVSFPIPMDYSIPSQRACPSPLGGLSSDRFLLMFNA